LEPTERLVRVWRGLDSLQAHFLRDTLIGEGIDCHLDRDALHLDLGMTDLGLWVAAADVGRARQVIAAYEAYWRGGAELGTDSER
jgi:hypothetical protein